MNEVFVRSRLFSIISGGPWSTWEDAVSSYGLHEDDGDGKELGLRFTSSPGYSPHKKTNQDRVTD